MGNQILVVDDDAEIREVLRVLLSSEGFQVVQAGSGEEALAYLERTGGGADQLSKQVNIQGLSGNHVCLSRR